MKVAKHDDLVRAFPPQSDVESAMLGRSMLKRFRSFRAIWRPAATGHKPAFYLKNLDRLLCEVKEPHV